MAVKSYPGYFINFGAMPRQLSARSVVTKDRAADADVKACKTKTLVATKTTVHTHGAGNQRPVAVASGVR